MAAVKTLMTGLRDLVLFTNAVLATRLHEIKYVKLEVLEKLINPRKRKLLSPFDNEPVHLLKRACTPAAYTPSCYGEYARFDDSDDSKTLGIADPAPATRLTAITYEETLDLERKPASDEVLAEVLAEIWKLAVTTRLPETTCDELMDLDPHPHKQPSYSDKLAECPGRACKPATTKEPPYFHGASANFDSNRFSEIPRIDGVAIPRHLVTLIQRDTFDLTESQNSRVARRLGYEFHDARASKENLTQCYNKQSSGKGRVEAVLYRRKGQQIAADPATSAHDDGMDARGRMIDRVVWSDRETAALQSNTSLSKRQRDRSPTPIREPVYQQAAKYSSETKVYQTQVPTPAPENVEYEQIELFSRAKGQQAKSPRPNYTHISNRILQQELNLSKFNAALEQEQLRKQRGGLMIDFEAHLRRRSTNLGQNAKISNAYATAFENWDLELQNSPLKELEGYSGNAKRRAWFRTMWEMPEK
jgi:hypothetical protein